jgi:hypothetical protein
MIKITEIYNPHLKISKYQWGEIEGVNKMKSMTPGEKVKKKPKMSEQKLPYLLMSKEQISKLNEEKTQLEFDGIQTKNLEICPSAYKEFKKMIDDIRAGKHLGELTGHEKDQMTLKNEPKLAVKTLPGSSDVVRKVQTGVAVKPATLRRMQFKQYTDA